MGLLALLQIVWTSEVVAALFAATTTDLADLGKYGLLGIFLVAMVVGQIVPGYIYKAVIKRAETAESANREMRALMDGQVMPLLRDNEQTMERVMGLMHETVGALRSLSKPT